MVQDSERLDVDQIVRNYADPDSIVAAPPRLVLALAEQCKILQADLDLAREGFEHDQADLRTERARAEAAEAEAERLCSRLHEIKKGPTRRITEAQDLVTSEDAQRRLRFMDREDSSKWTATDRELYVYACTLEQLWERLAESEEQAKRAAAVTALRNSASRLSWAEGDPDYNEFREWLVNRADAIENGADL